MRLASMPYILMVILFMLGRQPVFLIGLAGMLFGIHTERQSLLHGKKSLKIHQSRLKRVAPFGLEIGLCVK